MQEIMAGDLQKRVGMLTYGGNFYVRSSLVMVVFLISIRHHEALKFMLKEYDVLSIIVTILTEALK